MRRNISSPMVIETGDTVARLETALAALEIEAEALGQTPALDTTVKALAAPVAQFDAAAKEALA